MFTLNDISNRLTTSDVCFEDYIPVYDITSNITIDRVDETHPNYNPMDITPSFYIKFNTFTTKPPNISSDDTPSQSMSPNTQHLSTSPNAQSPTSTPNAQSPTPSPKNKLSLTSLFKQQKPTTTYPFTKLSHQSPTDESPKPLYQYNHILPRSLPRDLFAHHMVELFNSNTNLRFSKQLLYENLYIKYTLSTPHTTPDIYTIDVAERLCLTETSKIIIYITPNSLSQTVSPPPQLASIISQQISISTSILKEITSTAQLPTIYVNAISFMFHHQKPFLAFNYDEDTKHLLPSPSKEQITSTGHIYGPVNTPTVNTQRLYRDLNLSILKNKSIIDKSSTTISPSEVQTCIDNSISPEDYNVIDLYKFFRVKVVNPMIYNLKVYTFNPQSLNLACFTKSYQTPPTRTSYPRLDRRSTAILKTKFRYTVAYHYNPENPFNSPISPINSAITPKQFNKQHFDKSITFVINSFILNVHFNNIGNRVPVSNLPIFHNTIINTHNGIN